MPLFGRPRASVRRMRRRGDIDGLRAALRNRQVAVDSDGTELDLTVDVRAEAAAALGDFSADDVRADLATAVRDPHRAVRRAGLEAASRLKGTIALEPLLACVVEHRGDDEELSNRALDLLVEWRGEGAAEGLVERLLERGAEPVEDRHREALDRLLAVDPRGGRARDAAIDSLVQVLQDESDEQTEAAARRVIGWLGPAAVESVLAALNDGSVSPGVVKVAGLIGDARSVGPLIDKLASPEPALREAAAIAAGRLNHTRAVPALLTATQDQEQAVRDAASAALDRMGTAAVIAGMAALTVAGGELKVADAHSVLAHGGPQLHDAEPTPAASVEPSKEETRSTVEATGTGSFLPRTREILFEQPYRPASKPAGTGTPVRQGGLLERFLRRRT